MAISPSVHCCVRIRYIPFDHPLYTIRSYQGGNVKDDWGWHDHGWHDKGGVQDDRSWYDRSWYDQRWSDSDDDSR